MVKTRSGDALPDNVNAVMPVKDTSDVKDEIAEEDDVTVSSQQHESSEEKDITYRPDCYRELRNRFVFGRRAKRDARKVMSSRSLRKHYAEDDLEESNDAMLSDEDSEDLFPRRGKSASRRHMSSRHLDRRISRSLRLRHKQQMADDAELNGRDGGEDKGTGDGVRRSTRTRKQKYDNFNNSWIDGMNGHASLRGYPSMFPAEKAAAKAAAAAAAAAEGNDEAASDGPPAGHSTGYVYVSDAKEDKEPSEEEEEDETRPMKRGRTLAELDTSNGDLQNGDDLDMYSRVKRLRRPAKRFMFEDDNEPSTTGRIGGRQTETQSSQTSTDDESEEEKVPKYSLRKTKPMVDRFQASIDPPRQGRSSRVMRSMLRRHCKRRARSPSTSSSEEERFDRSRAKSSHNKTLSSRCLPTPMNLEANGLQSRPGDLKAPKSNLADVDPMTLDRSIMFANVGGLAEHICCLKEMVVFPMLYPEVFDRFHIQPAKGVLFHGLPGTGKTLLARALANECSQGDRKVAFFMRKGADCLTKWVGESERQLRLLFDQAYQMRPSIIFFDEIDGLAPVRSTKQDQIHASIVSTLLALMDGLDSRGEVIVIGATNRVDAIDPALRRPGRFDRELYFPLPARQERQEILRIHVSKWDSPPAPQLLTSLADQAAGYCGSDLRALCSEAVLQGLRRRYPQIYTTNQKLLLDPNAVTVETEDFLRARSTIVPAANRCTPSAGRKLPTLVAPLLTSALDSAVDILRDSFPHGVTRSVASSQLLNLCHSVHRPHLLLTAPDRGYGQNMLGPALLSYMEHVAVHVLDLSALCQTSSLSAEEACIQVFNEARRNLPSIVYVPSVCRMWDLTSDTLHAVFLSKLHDIDPASPVLLLATSDTPYEDLPAELSAIFSQYRGEVLTLSAPTSASRLAFFTPLFLESAPSPPPRRPEEAAAAEELPLAPPPEVPKLSEEQLKLCYEQEEQTLRELRIFLRDCCSKLARNRLFFMFTKPVDIDEVPDYLNIIKQPMDLETMMTKIDLHRYACAQEFLNDIDLTVRNALEYNPDRTGEDKLIRHRACCLRDTAYALIKAEMDTDYEDKCKKISVSRQQRSDSPSRFVPEFIRTKPVLSSVTFGNVDVARTTRGGLLADPVSKPVPPPTAPKPLAKKAPAAVANGILKRAWHVHKARKRRSAWSRGFLAKKPSKSPGGGVKRVRPIVAARDVHIPVSHAPVIAQKSDSDDEPLVNGTATGNSSDGDAKPNAVSETSIRSPVMVNGTDAEHVNTSPELNAKASARKEKQIAFTFNSADISVSESVKERRRSSAAQAEERMSRSSRSPSKQTTVVSPVASTSSGGRRSLDVADVADAGLKSPRGGAELETTPMDTSLADEESRTVIIDVDALKALLRRTVAITDGCTFDTLLDLHAQLNKHVFRFSKDWDRTALLGCLSNEVDRFQKLKSRNAVT